MKHKEHFRTAVYQTPFHPRTSALNTLNEWHRWKDYTTADAYFDEALEYAAIEKDRRPPTTTPGPTCTSWGRFTTNC